MVAMAAFRRCDADIVILFIEFGVRSSHVEFCGSDIWCVMMLELTTLSYLVSYFFECEIVGSGASIHFGISVD